MDRSATVGEGDLIRGFLSGEPGAIRVIDGWIDAALMRDFRSLRGDWEDLRQETRIRILRNLRGGRFDGRSALRTYIHRIAKNVAIDSSRLTYRRRESPASSGYFAAVASDKGASDTDFIARDLLLRVMQGLPEGDRLLLTLVFGDHLSYSEVARRIGTTEGAVKTRMCRCKDRIVSRARDLMK